MRYETSCLVSRRGFRFVSLGIFFTVRFYFLCYFFEKYLLEKEVVFVFRNIWFLSDMGRMAKENKELVCFGFGYEGEYG